MKNIAVLGSASGQNLKAIADYFKDKNISVTAVSDIENSDFLETAKTLNLKWKFLPYEQNFEYFSSHDFDIIALSDYRRQLKNDVLELGKFISVHPSLLPAFKGPDAINRAFFAGVKVSGVTVHIINEDIDSGKIIAQYPVLISNLTHYDEFEHKIHALEDLLYPIVIAKLLNNQVFDFSDLIQNCGSCGGCGGCN